MQRDIDKWKRECVMLKEEMSILGSNEKDKEKKKSKKEKKLVQCSLNQGITPKGN